MTLTRVTGMTGAGAAAALVVLLGMSNSSLRVHADSSGESLTDMGLAMAPVPLNLKGLDRDLVGWGSYLVNAIGDCNGCHTGGGYPNFNYAPGFNPYFGQKPKVDPNFYLSGGQDFGPAGTPTGSTGYAGPDIVSRNLTPDKTGLPEGGHSLSQFKQIIRTGIDFDHLHPTCTPGQMKLLQQVPPPKPLPVCIPTSPDNPVDGSVLQIMPWPTFQNMTDHDLDAIYEYLRAIPCLEGSPDPKSPLHNDCK